MASGTAGPEVEENLERWSAVVPDRGACHHPNGAMRFVLSALAVFREEFAEHRRGGPCELCTAPSVLPVPERLPEWWQQ
jgi:hypothetical protein